VKAFKATIASISVHDVIVTAEDEAEARHKLRRHYRAIEILSLEESGEGAERAVSVGLKGRLGQINISAVGKAP
jgi:hypothetical protein